MPNIKYRGQIRDGRLHMADIHRKQMAAEIAGLKEGKWVEIEIKVLPLRSNQFNNFYWAVPVPMIRDAFRAMGHDVDSDQTHEVLKAKFNKKVICDDEGTVIAEVGGSTAEMSTSEFMDYIANIQRWAAETLDLYVPDPNEQTEMKFDQ